MHIRPAVSVLVTAVTLAALVSGCHQKQEGVTAPQAPQVGVVTLQSQAFVLTTELPGRTSAFRAAEVRPQVNGIILKRLFTEGADVKAGDQLYQIDPALYQATANSAKATFQSAKSLADRYKLLVNDHAVSRQEYDTAAASALAAQAAVQASEINLRYAKVIAPIDGRIGRSAVTEGALVNNGQPEAMAVIQQLDPIYVDVVQSSAELIKLRHELENGQLQKAGNNAAKVKLTLEDESAYPLEGTLEFSEVSVDQTTGSITLRAQFANPNHVLLPGMFVHASLQSGVLAAAILVPQQGVTRDLKGTPTALIVNKDNKVELRHIVASRTVGNDWLVDSGLNVGDRVITEGLQYVKPGTEVRVSDATNIQPKSTGAAPAPALASEKTASGRGA
ncbi:MAG: efflux RND transporter periplasmic adaptor subunit [Pseudomonas sp.]